MLELGFLQGLVFNHLTADVLHVSHEMVLACSGCSASHTCKIIKNGLIIMFLKKGQIWYIKLCI